MNHEKLLITLKNNKVETVTVDMGEPILEPARVPVDLAYLADPAAADASKPAVSVPIEVDDQICHVTCVSMGNPHSVLFVNDVDTLDLERIGPSFENHPLFPNRVNTEFIQIVDRSHVKMRVWERGSGETMACGTGACASTVACVLNDLTDRHLYLDLLGGRLDITWDEESGHVFMTGPAATSFEGEW